MRKSELLHTRTALLETKTFAAAGAPQTPNGSTSAGLQQKIRVKMPAENEGILKGKSSALI